MVACETCAFYAYDEEYDEYFCDVGMDQDEVAHLVMNNYKECPYYRNGDEYETVRHQM